MKGKGNRQLQACFQHTAGRHERACRRRILDFDPAELQVQLSFPIGNVVDRFVVVTERDEYPDDTADRAPS